MARMAVLFLAAGGALQVAYPWSIPYGGFHFGWLETLGSYLFVAALMAFTGAVLAPSIVAKSNVSEREPTAAVVLVGVTTFLVLLVVTAVFSGPGLARNVPGTRVSGIFFAEWEFMRFVFYVAIPFSLLAGVLQKLEIWRLRRHAERTPR